MTDTDRSSLERRALELAKAGDFGDEAAAVNAALVAQAPANAAALKRLGRCHLEQRRFDEAVDALRAALALNPTDTVATSLLGEVRRRRALTPRAADRVATGFTAREFDALATLRPEEALRRLAPRIDALTAALNGSMLAERVAETRRRHRAAGARLFDAGSAQAPDAGHVFVEPVDRFEPQWRLAWLAPPAIARRGFCAGLRFDLASPDRAEAAHLALERFRLALGDSWKQPLADWMAANGGFVQFGAIEPLLDVDPVRALEALMSPPAGAPAGWIFIGRWWFLDRPNDAAVLADRAKLARRVDDAFRALLPLWLAALTTS